MASVIPAADPSLSVLGESAPGAAINPAMQTDCLSPWLKEVTDKLDRVSEGDYDWALEEGLRLPPAAAVDYCRREARNVAELLAFRESHKCAELIPAPVIWPYGEDGGVRLGWNSGADEVEIELEWGDSPVWNWYHLRGTDPCVSGSVSVNDENLWETLKDKVASVFAG